jgi:hypothetical protein
VLQKPERATNPIANHVSRFYKRVKLFVPVFLIVGMLGYGFANNLLTSPASNPIDQTNSVPEKLAQSLVLKAAAAVPTYFVPNEGQINDAVDFYVEGNGRYLYLNDESISYVQVDEREPTLSLTEGPSTEPVSRSNTVVRFVDANPDVHPVSLTQTETTFSYFMSSSEPKNAGIKASSAIVYKNLWDGIDLRVEGQGGSLKYTYDVAPGADPSQIKLHYEGADVSLQPNGDLDVKTPLGGFIDQAPTATQPQAQDKNTVDVAFTLSQDQSGYIQSFALGTYNPNLPLSIDPIVLEWATLIGSTAGGDDARAISADSTGVYVGSWVGGAVTSFPVSGTFDTSFNGSSDSFVYKLSPDGMTVIYATYIGGTGEDGVNGIDIDAGGNAYITLNTASTDYPTTPGVHDTTHNGTIPANPYDGVIAKINPTGTALVYSTFFGGSASDISLEIAVDAAGEAYVTGATGSTSATFPETAGSFDPSNNGGVGDNFAGRINATATAWDYLGFIGGSGDDGCCNNDIVIDGDGNAYVMNWTTSTQATFPDGNGFGAVPGYDQTHAGGTTDYYIVKINPAGSALLGGTYLGGSGEERGETGNESSGAIELANGSLYVTGSTSSTQTTFPAITGPDLTHNGGFDGFLTRMSTDLLTVTSSGFFGGSGSDWFNDIESDSDGNIYLAAATSSTESTLPLVDGPDLDYNGGTYDGLIVKIDATDLSTVFSGYIGGDSYDRLNKIAVIAPNTLYGGFETTSTETTLPNGYGFYSIPGIDQTANGNQDQLIIKLQEVPAGVVVTESGGSTDIIEGGATDTYDVVLISRPTFNVTVPIAPNAQQTTNLPSLTFTPLNWDVPQTVTVTAVQDGIEECKHTGLITHTATSQDLNYHGIGVASVVTNIDDHGCADIILTESDNSTDISEVGPTSDNYNVVLTREPLADVVVSIFPNTQQTTDKSALTFTASNWDTPQVVTVTAVADSQVECPHTGMINHIADSGDAEYDGYPVVDVVPNITDGCVLIPGDDPKQQSVEVSRYRFPNDHTALAAIIARDNLMADAFTGISFASIRQAPLLLTNPNSIDAALVTELRRVLSNNTNPIYILGREDAVTPAVYEQLRAEGFENLIQLGGENRRETAAIIANTILATQGTVTRVFITEDEKLVDSLSAGAPAGLLGSDGLADPILLLARGQTTIDPHTDAFLRAQPSITSLEIIGHDSAIPTSLDATFAQRYPQLTSIVRSGGNDRFGTNVLIANRFFSSPEGVVVASGLREHIPGALSATSAGAPNFFAALLAGTVAAQEEWPLMLVTNYSLPAVTRSYLVSNANTINGLIVVGGTDQVSTDVIDQILSVI